jgi:cellulose biosynthesis protein BcsQ
MITIAFANQKGGVAKTNSAQHIGHGLALAGLSVLLIDLDSQGNLADGLGWIHHQGCLTGWLVIVCLEKLLRGFGLDPALVFG